MWEPCRNYTLREVMCEPCRIAITATLVWARCVFGLLFCKYTVFFYHITREFLVCIKYRFYQAVISGLVNMFCGLVESYVILWTKDRVLGYITLAHSTPVYDPCKNHFTDYPIYILCSLYSVTKWPLPNISRELCKRRNTFIPVPAPSCWKFSALPYNMIALRCWIMFVLCYIWEDIKWIR